MIRRNPASIRARHLIAPLFVLSLAALAIGSLFSNLFLWMLLVDVGAYVVSTLLAAAHIVLTTRANPLMLALLPPTFAAIHLSWGTSFLIGLLTDLFQVRR